MLEKLYIAGAVLAAVLAIVKPKYGLYYLLFNFLVQPMHTFGFSEGLSFKVNAGIMAALLLSVFPRMLATPCREYKVTLAVLALLAIGFISGVLNSGPDFFDPSNGANIKVTYMLKRVIFILVFFYCMNNRKDFLQTVKACLFFCMCNGAFAMAGMLFGVEAAMHDEMYVNRARGFQDDANMLAAMLNAMIPLAYYFFLHQERRIGRWISFAYLGALVGGVFSTVSRGGLIGLLFVAMCLFVKNLKRISTLLVVGLLAIFFLTWARDFYADREVLKTKASGKVELSTSAFQRVQTSIWGLQIWLQNPVFGRGPDCSVEAIQKDLGIRYRNVIHNVYVLVAAEYGTLGFAAFMSFFVIAFRALGRLIRSDDPFCSEFARCNRMSLLVYMLCSTFGPCYLELMLWITVSLPVALERIVRLEQLGAAPPGSVSG